MKKYLIILIAGFSLSSSHASELSEIWLKHYRQEQDEIVDELERTVRHGEDTREFGGDLVAYVEQLEKDIRALARAGQREQTWQNLE